MKSRFPIANICPDSILRKLALAALLGLIAPSAWAQQVVSIYFCGTGIKSDAYLAQNTSWGDPELLATLYQADSSVEIQQGPWNGAYGAWTPPVHAGTYPTPHRHHKYIVNGVGTSPGTNPVDVAISVLGTADPNLGARTWHNVVVEAQQALAEVRNHHPGEDIILNLVGYSRGAVSVMMMARALTDQAGWNFVRKINILDFDPVPGGLDPIGAFGTNFHLSSKVNQFVGLYSEHERSYQMEPVLPRSESSSTKMLLVRLPGSHETLVGNLQVDGHSVTILQDLALVAAGIGPTTPNANFRYVKDTARAVAERLLTSEEWGRVPLAVDQSLWTNGVDSKEKFSSLLNAMWGQDYELTSIFGFFLMWGTYDPLYAVLGRDYMLRTIGLLPPPGNQSRLCFVAPQRHAFEYVWWLFPFFFANAEQVYYLEQQVPRINAATWDTLEALRGQPPPDTTPPVPSVNPLPTITGEGSVTITTPPKATDDVSGTVFGTTSNPLSYTMLGTYTVTWTYRDASGNTATQRQTVIVRDTIAPALTIPSNQVLEATSAAGAIATFSATATDQVTAAPTLTYSRASGSVFPLGTTSVSVTATDGAGNPTTGNFTITVRDTTAPVIAVPANVTAEATSAAGAVVQFTTGAADLVSGAVAVTASPASGSTFPLGMTTVSLSATDAASNANTRAFTVTVVDTIAPKLTLPVNQVLEATSAAGAIATFRATATDQVTAAPALTYSRESGSVFPLGMTTVSITATDGAGNTSTGEFTITVRDTTAPVIAVPANVTAEATSAAGAVVQFTTGAADLVSGAVTVTASPASGTIFPLGATTVSLSATDTASNTNTRTFTVTVVDTIAPALILPGNQLLEASSAAGAVATFSATATDQVTAAPTLTYSHASGSVFPLGTTSVSVTATDGAGNPTTGSFTITVRDTTAPVITIPANVTAEATSAAGAVVQFTTGAADLVSGAVAVTASPASGSTFPLGITTVSLSATDAAGNANTRAFTVTVVDTIAPALTLPDNQALEATSAVGAVATFGATATDQVTATPALTYSRASGSVFPLGITSVTVTATDGAGNATTGSFTITVRDTTAPAFVSLTPSQTSLWPPNNQMVAITLTALARDNVGMRAIRIVNVTCNEPSKGAANDVEITGALTVNLRATRAGNGDGRIYSIAVEASDAAGNASTTTTTVTVPKSQGKK